MSALCKLKVQSNNILLKKFPNSQPGDAESPKPTAKKLEENSVNCLVSPKVTTVSPKPPFSICLHCATEDIRARFNGLLVALRLAKYRPVPWSLNLTALPPILIVPGMNVEIIREHIIKTEKLRDSFERAMQSSGLVLKTSWLESRIRELDQEIKQLRQIYEIDLRDSLQRELTRREFERENRAMRLKNFVEFITNPSRWWK